MDDRKQTFRCAIYARCSTTKQEDSTATQLHELYEYAARRGWAVIEFVDEAKSGARADRPALASLMASARARKIDAVIVVRLDRFGRSLKHLVVTLDELRELGVAFVSLRDGLDFSTATGRLLFGVIASVAQFERELTIERVRAGLQTARRKGKRLGRPPVSAEVERAVRSVAGSALSIRAIQRAIAQGGHGKLGLATIARIVGKRSKNPSGTFVKKADDSSFFAQPSARSEIR